MVDLSFHSLYVVDLFWLFCSACSGYFLQKVVSPSYGLLISTSITDVDEMDLILRSKGIK